MRRKNLLPVLWRNKKKRITRGGFHHCYFWCLFHYCLHGISLIHSKPYDSPSRGKVERFFRTVRERFLSALQERMTLEELNEAFTLWLKDDYHHKLHSGIEERPIDRYNASIPP